MVSQFSPRHYTTPTTPDSSATLQTPSCDRLTVQYTYVIIMTTAYRILLSCNMCGLI